MAKHVFTRAQYLDILNDSLRNHPGWRPGMAFVFLPPGAMQARQRPWDVRARSKPFPCMRRSSA